MIPKEIEMRKMWIYEVIVTTYSNNKPNAAPMGVWTDDLSCLILEIYKGSETCRNILRNREFVVNFTDDILLFYGSIHAKDDMKYSKAEKVNAPVLNDAPGFLELRAGVVEDRGDRVGIRAVIVNSNLNGEIKLLNRAESLALELLINHTKTRVPAISKARRESLKERMKDYLRIIKKVAPDSGYEGMAENLVCD